MAGTIIIVFLYLFIGAGVSFFMANDSVVHNVLCLLFWPIVLIVVDIGIIIVSIIGVFPSKKEKPKQ